MDAVRKKGNPRAGDAASGGRGNGTAQKSMSPRRDGQPLTDPIRRIPKSPLQEFRERRGLSRTELGSLGGDTRSEQCKATLAIAQAEAGLTGVDDSGLTYVWRELKRMWVLGLKAQQHAWHGDHFGKDVAERSPRPWLSDSDRPHLYRALDRHLKGLPIQGVALHIAELFEEPSEDCDSTNIEIIGAHG